MLEPQTISRLESFLGVKKYPSAHERELFEKTQDFVRLIRWIPGLRMIAVSNSLAMYATHAGSDIDLFIVAAPRRLWIVRTLVLLTATILCVRTRPGDEAGKFCFPFFMTEAALDLSPLAIEDDIYLAYWIRTLKPILNRGYVYGRFMQINAPELPPESIEKNREFLLEEPFHRRDKKIPGFLSGMLDWIDDAIADLSLPGILRRVNALEDHAGIAITEHILKLHYHDRRAEVRDAIL